MFFPETKGLELEEIDHIFEKGGVAGEVWNSKKTRRTERFNNDDATEVDENVGVGMNYPNLISGSPPFTLYSALHSELIGLRGFLEDRRRLLYPVEVTDRDKHIHVE
ncbi:hypothetical protein M422DRAFT_775803 [Sphaerobolus stellatus SS14]|nr:hypothetical protein M422DRAFT_775803 [Sphaerobolus stellatus SS14]